MIPEKLFIRHPDPFDPTFQTDKPAPLFRRHFTAGDNLMEARLRVCALGLGVLYLNGQLLTEDLFLSPVSDYRKTLWYSEYDVTDRIRNGTNVAAAAIGNGFFNESIHTAWNFQEASWRNSPMLLFELTLFYEDHTETVRADSEWLCMKENSPYRFNEFRYGEVYDARMHTDWMMPEYDDSRWEHVVPAAAPDGELRLCPAPPIREDRAYECIRVTRNKDGAYVFDFGQNMSGYVRIRTHQPAGTRLHIVYAEQLEADGTRRDNNMTRCYKDGETQTSTLICGDAPIVWSPSFSYYGFRYAIVDGFASEPAPGDLQGIFIHQDVLRLGNFSCSDNTLNKLFRFSALSTLSNLFNMPTDCPTREKLGWCNDAQASAEQMLQNFDMIGFYEKWMQDLLDAQLPNGDLPGIVPTSGWGYHWGNGPTSTGVLFEIPYRVYQYTGSDYLLCFAYDAMIRHLAFYRDKIDPENGLYSYGLGDWAWPLHRQAPPPTPLTFTTTLLLIKMLRIAALAADRCAKPQDSEKLLARARNLSEKVKQVYLEETGRCRVHEQTAVAMLIALGIYDRLAPLHAQLKETVEEENFHFRVGMLGMQYLLPALEICGLEEYGYRLLTAEGFPSYREWFSSDATTLYEKWYDDESRNHHMYSCVIAWFYRRILGIRMETSVFTDHTVEISPCFLEKLRFARGIFRTAAGTISVSWEREENGVILLQLDIPASLHFTLNLPSIPASENTFAGGHYTFRVAQN